MENKNNDKIIAVRFVLGLSIIAAQALIALLVHKSVMLPYWGMVVMPMLIPLFLPPLAIGLYLMFSSKTRWRVDITLILITIISLVAFALAKFNNL
jgi:hypothetical protein